jgi:hypothetical protein
MAPLCVRIATAASCVVEPSGNHDLLAARATGLDDVRHGAPLAGASPIRLRPAVKSMAPCENPVSAATRIAAARIIGGVRKGPDNMNMSRSLWLLTQAVAISVTLGVAAADAQTVIVRNAPTGSQIEVQVNAESARSATADNNGDATFTVGLAAGTGQGDVRFFVDSCGASVRVHLVSAGLQPGPSATGCNRSEVWGVFVARPVTTFVVDLEGSVASIHLTQGPAPLAWLSRGQLAETPGRYFLGQPPTGLVLFGGAGIPLFSNTIDAACGNVTTCSGNSFIGAGAAGAAFWISRFVGAQFTLAKPAHVVANGTGDTFRFGSTLDSRLATVAGTVGVPAGPVRLYGLAGANYHRATFITTETINDVTVVVDSLTQTIKGGTQTFEHHTEGWNWLLGGGLEAWATKSIAIYAEVQRARLKATDLGAVESGIDDSVTFVVAGARVRLGR